MNQTLPILAVASISPIPPNEMAGAIVVNVFAILSTVALFSIFVGVSWLAVLRLLGHNISQSFFNTQLGYYAACLLISNMINGIAGLMGLPWLLKRGITDNAICTTQAAVMQTGNIATAYFTVAIAVHTFNSLVLRKRQSIYIYGPTIVVGWALSFILAFLPLISKMGPIYGPSGLACGVRTKFPQHMFFFHLLPIFVAALLSAILYSLIFLVLRGFIAIKGGIRMTLNPEDRWRDRASSTYQRFVASIAKSMLWYPAAYIFLLVPYSVTRLLSIGGFTIPFQAMVFAFVCWFALGVVNALLLYNTFRVLGPAFEAKSTAGSGSGFQQAGDLESFGTTETFKRVTMDTKGPRHLNLTDAMIKEYRGSDLSSPSTYNSSAAPSYPERSASAQSSYRQANAEDVARQISPVSMLNESIVVEAPGSMLSPHPPTRAHMPDHTRQESESSITSLPTPPRRTPTPSRLLIDRVEPTIPRTIATSSPTFSYSPITRPAAARPTLSPRNLAPSSPASLRRINEGTRLSDASTSSSISGDLDITAWLARQNPDGSMPSAEMRHQPMLSAVQPNFPASANSVNPSASPAARLRPLLLASVERTGSMVLAEHYNRLYPYSPADEQSR